ncbi:MAG TPA: response regulator [Steroidobacteraceae bacterium]|jgi:DNA-binding NtrC family response regulator|nr:response regulator [Steroidobacteraceae bacterium]
MEDPVEAPDPDSVDDRHVVLIVEDEFLLRWPTSEFLRESGYRVIEVASVSEAIMVFSSNTRVDLVFSDVNLEGDLTGHALASWLEKHHPAIPMLLTSGDKRASNVVSSGAARPFVAKPYVLADVEQRIKDMLTRNG